MVKKSDKPKGRMSSYAFFVQTCREEHKKKHPGESVVFAEFTKKCAAKWKEMSGKEKKRFEDMAERDKARYEDEMADYTPAPGAGGGGGGGKKRKQPKDPNKPKRALSAFFFFCNDERGKVKAVHPDYTVADIAKELGKQWEKVKDKSKFEASAAKDKARYEKDMQVYRAGGIPDSVKAASGASPKKKAKKVVPEPQVEEEEEEEEEEEDDEEEDDEDDE